VSRSWFCPRLFGSCDTNTTDWPARTAMSISHWHEQLQLYGSIVSWIAKPQDGW
jgi:hypothetical protein